MLGMADVLRRWGQRRVLVSPSDSLLACCGGDVCLSVGGGLYLLLTLSMRANVLVLRRRERKPGDEGGELREGQDKKTRSHSGLTGGRWSG